MSTGSNSKLSAMIGYLLTFFRKQPIIALYFEFENDSKFYNLGALLNQAYSYEGVKLVFSFFDQ